MSTALEEIRMMERDVMSREIKIEDPTECFYCKSKGLSEENKFCPNCRFPQGGTELEQKNFYIGTAKKRMQLKEKISKVNRAKYVLFALAGLNFLIGLIVLFSNQAEAILLFSIQLFIALIFLGLGFWCIKKPFIALVVGFAFYIFLVALGGILDPATLIKGIIWKVLIISAFVYGINSVKEGEKLEKELAEIKTPNDFTFKDDLSELPS